MIKTKKIILLGAPGSGKGTLSQDLLKYNYVQISTGDLFRKKLQEDTREAKEIQAIINRGELIPDSITNNLAKQEILKNIKANKNIILDGYPRTIEQAKFLETICYIDNVIYLDVDHDVLLKRITGRISCKQCNKVYNEYTNPPKQKEICDNCNIPLVRRRDDNKESFEIRMMEFNSKTAPLIEFYSNHNQTKFNKIHINGTESTQDILEKTLKIIDSK